CSVTLSATGSAGTLRWYNQPAGGTSLATGPSYTTPVISSTTTYYVGAEVSGPTQAVGPATNGIGTGGSMQSSDGLLFDVTSMIRLEGVYVYPTTTGTTAFEVRDKYGVLVGSASATMTSSNLNTKTWVPAGFVIPAGTGYRMNMPSTGTLCYLYRNNAGAVWPYTLPGVVSITANTAGNAYYYYWYDWQVSTFCSSPRAAVTATIATAPPLTLSPVQTVCNGGITALSVLSALSNYDSYAWSPAAGLYTDTACTTAYVAGTSAATVYFRTLSGGSYTFTCTAHNSVTGCSQPATTTVTVLPADPVITGIPRYFCNSGSSTISLSPATGWGAAAFQWTTSADNITFSNIPGATNSTYNTPSLSDTAFYHLKITNSAGLLCAEPAETITVLHPQLTSITPGSRCNTGSVTLQATAMGGEATWYSAPTGWGALATGPVFNTPSIASTTTYYVDCESHLDGSVILGAGATQSTSPNPFYGYYGGSKTQYLVPASELLAAGLTAGNLTSLSFELSDNANETYHSFTLSIGNTTQTSLTTTFQAEVYPVFTADSVMPPAGVYTIPFTVPYAWDGVSSLMVETCWSNNNAGNNWVNVKNDYTSYISTAYFRANNLEPVILCGAATADNSLYYRPRMTFGGQVRCVTSRNAVLATVTSPPTLTVTAGRTLCAGETYPLSVTSAPSNFDLYTWSPATGLYTDAGCTQPYIDGSHAVTVYVKHPDGGTTVYICTATQYAGNCIDTAQIPVTVLPASAAISSSPAVVCASGSAMLTLSPATGWGAATFQWQGSPDNQLFTDIAGATGTTYVTPVVSSTTWYRLTIRNGAGTTCLSVPFTLPVENPAVTSVTDGVRCGPGSVTLQATAGGGGTLKWYTSPTDMNPVGSGSPFITPPLNLSTVYYVAAEGSSAITETTGQVAVSTSSARCFSNYGVMFNAHRDLILNSVTVYPLGTGTLTVALLDSSGAEIASTAAVDVTGNGLANEVSLGFFIPAGNQYKLVLKNWSGFTWMNFEPPSYALFPYISGSGAMTVTSGWKANTTSTNNYFFYALNLTNGCRSPRSAVQAILTLPPAITPTATPDTICSGASSTLAVTSSNPEYVYTWTPGNLTGPLLGVSPAATTTYTCNAGVPGAACATSATVTVTVSDDPLCGNLSVTGSPGGRACYNTHDTIFVVGGPAQTFTASPGDTATFIAGVSILFRPGTVALPGAYLVGYISNTFCQPGDAPEAPVVASTGTLSIPGQASSFLLFPNPTGGDFIVARRNGAVMKETRIEIYSFDGRKILTGMAHDEWRHSVAFAGQPEGIYLVKIVCGSSSERLKLVKTQSCFAHE
ncbi:MAG TPA: T9SS type A sorting domain-containing protein, partial [Bacteroidales bacterium]|nr:T9SS type A sorting domain-containing protein [Bacteroidales bacterium]